MQVTNLQAVGKESFARNRLFVEVFVSFSFSMYRLAPRGHDIVSFSFIYKRLVFPVRAVVLNDDLGWFANDDIYT